MPSTIPYDPSLTLGNVVPKEKLDNLIQIAKAQADPDSKEATLNSLITLKRSLDLTVEEMINMGVDVTDLINDSKELGKQLKDAAKAYADAKIAAEKKIQPLRAKIIAVSEEIESPIDYNRSSLKQMPLAADSLQMNVQYFSFDRNKQDASSQAASIAGFVSEQLQYEGEGQTTQVSGAVSKQVHSQYANHSIEGTLVIAITCTHKNAQIFAPFILDIDKAVRAWNAMFPDDMIKTNDPKSIADIEAKTETSKENSFQILSGATYGSSFVGMVHVLNTTETSEHEDMESLAASLQETFDVGAWAAEVSGGFGVEGSVVDGAKQLLSQQNIQSHCSAVTMGIIPSIKSNQVKSNVQEFTKFDPEQDMKNLAILQGYTSSENNTMADAAMKARTGEQMLKIHTSTIKSALSSLSTIDQSANSIIDLNSMMTAMDDYIQRCVSGGDNLGVPINYFLKPITKGMIARAWLAKYYPNKFNQSGSADDSKDDSKDDKK